jgi:predicted unusual protein kinase regulating ubiquinone biosynthesis (AarF/ABC1/UbiB family)
MANSFDSSSFTGRVKRYAKVSTRVSGFAARVAGEKVLGVPIGDHGKQAAKLAEALGGLKGPLMKIAQILSTIPDAVPEEYAKELSQLQSNAPEMGWAFVRRRMKTELGADWQDNFATFEKQACAAASLGQVHRASTHDGQDVACKLQYPDMASAVEADLRQLTIILALYRSYDKAIDPQYVKQEIADRLREELSYTREAANMKLFANMLAKEPHVHVPVCIPSLSTDRLLTMRWMEGTKITDKVETAPELRNDMAKNLFRAWYIPFYEYGVIHGDPHLGNYTVTDTGDLNLLDFGTIRIFPPRFVGAVIDLYHALLHDDMDLAVHAYECWGFTGLTRETIDVLNMWAQFIYAPLMEDKVRRIQDTDNGLYGREVAEKVHAELKRIGGVKPPKEFALMDRAAIGLGSVFLRLKAELNWYQLFHEIAGEFSESALRARQQQALQSVGLQHMAEDAAAAPASDPEPRTGA